jgi:Transposase DDE domain
MPYKERLKSGEARKKPKPGYAPKDWSAYNKSLRSRGMISLYFPKGDLRKTLVNLNPYVEGVSGQQPTYNTAYVSILFILYRMQNKGLRQFAGFMADYWQAHLPGMPVPSFGHLSDLFAKLDLLVQQQCTRTVERIKRGEKVAVIVDSSGLRFSNARDWYAKKYGKSASCEPWRMMHLAMDDVHGDILELDVTTIETGDSTALDNQLPKLGPIAQLIADSNYYQIERNERLMAQGVIPIIPPKSTAVADPDQQRWHDKLVNYIKEKGMYAFQIKYDYGRRSRVEAMFSRIKRCIGDTLKTRRDASQVQEGRAIAILINLWNSFGQAHCVKTA